MPLVLLLSCLKPAEVPQAAVRAPVLVAAVVESFDSAEVAPPPDDVTERLAEVVGARNLEVRVELDVASFEAKRTTQARLDALAAAGPEAVLLVELAPRFSAQASGRYRWTVETDVTLLPVGRPEAALARSFTVPVHLSYAHEQEPDAAREAAAVVAREVGQIVDAWVTSR